MKNINKKLFGVLLAVVLVFSVTNFALAQEPSVTGNPIGTPSATGNPIGTPSATGNPGGVPSQTGNPNGGTPTNTSGGQQGSFFLQNPLSSNFNTVGGIIGGFLEIFTYLVVFGAILAIIWVGFQFIMAQGNPEELNKLKSWLLWIVVGLAIVIGARIIVKVVISTLESTQVVDPRVIQSARNAINQ